MALNEAKLNDMADTADTAVWHICMVLANLTARAPFGTTLSTMRATFEAQA